MSVHKVWITNFLFYSRIVLITNKTSFIFTCRPSRPFSIELRWAWWTKIQIKMDILIQKMYNHNHRVVSIIRMFLLMSHLIVIQIHSSSREEFLMTLAILWDLKRQKLLSCDNLWKLRGAGGPSVGLPWDENYLLIMNRLLRVWKPPTLMITNRYRNFVNYLLKIIIVFLNSKV